MLPALRNGSSLRNVFERPINRISSLFDRIFNEDFFAPLTTGPAWMEFPLSMWQDEDKVHVELDAPGMTEKDIEVLVESGQLVIRGERKCERKSAGYDTRSYGQFEQRLTLPAEVDTDKVDAKLVNGVLSIEFAKSEAAKPRRIALKTQ